MDAGETIGQELSVHPYMSCPCRKDSTHGTRLVWNSLRSTLREPSKRSEAVTDETTCAMMRFKFEKPGDGMFRFFLQIS